MLCVTFLLIKSVIKKSCSANSDQPARFQDIAVTKHIKTAVPLTTSACWMHRPSLLIWPPQVSIGSVFRYWFWRIGGSIQRRVQRWNIRNRDWDRYFWFLVLNINNRNFSPSLLMRNWWNLNLNVHPCWRDGRLRFPCFYSGPQYAMFIPLRPWFKIKNMPCLFCKIFYIARSVPFSGEFFQVSWDVH